MNQASPAPADTLLELDALPSARELGFCIPGVQYLWCLFQNSLHAQRVEGWSQIQIRSPGSSQVTHLRPFRVRGADVVLLARGRPLQGVAAESCGIHVRIDPELEALLKGPQEAAQPPSEPLLPPRPKPAPQARASR